MAKRTAAYVLLSIVFLTQPSSAQGPTREAPAPDVSFERLLSAGEEPENWLTYSGSFMSQRHSRLTQIHPGNVRALELKWETIDDRRKH
jgi:glucose dehydrogenase